jgi:hypothetical protein
LLRPARTIVSKQQPYAASRILFHQRGIDSPGFSVPLCLTWATGVVQVKDLSVSSYAEQVLQVAKPLREAGPLLAVTDFFLAAHTNHAGQELGNINLAELPRERMLVLV